MKVFHCDHCETLVFFENTHCISCGHQLAYLPDLDVVGSLDPIGNELWTTPIPRSDGTQYRLCSNYKEYNTCNWGVRANSPESLCVCCQLTQVIPDLTISANRESWYKLEVAKRRLVYGLMQLRLPIFNKYSSPEIGLAFEFKTDVPNADVDAEPVRTGHANGVITIHLSEADDAEREKRRVQLHEPYRTLLGHFRHEVGHYYWDRLIRDNPVRLLRFRNIFGDEQLNYSNALEHHYQNGPPSDWMQRHVSAYATMHPWEDWAETWAHYMHMTDTLETAASCGLSLRPHRFDEPHLTQLPEPEKAASFDDLIASWLPVTYVINNLNRGLGLPDGYPFILPQPAVEKLRFIHEVIAEQRG